ncbi:MAG: DUF4157 domain-containing protein [Saprospiraceae bacterium]|nr:DUF4157 domain-containing protein [Saprospiraceae bacterium]
MKVADSKTSSAAQHTQSQSQNAQPFFQRQSEGGQSAFFGSGEHTTDGAFFQPKLRIGAVNDQYEQQADRVAEQVVNSPKNTTESKNNQSPVNNNATTPSVNNAVQAKCAHCEAEEKKTQEDIQPMTSGEMQRKPIFDSAADPTDESNTIQRKCSTCESEETTVQRSSDTEGSASPEFESQLSSSKGGGSALPADTQQKMESSMGADFSGVRVHTGSEAANLSDNINARAFTHGNDIYFNSGEYNPSSSEGQRLLAHELTHTVQQGAAVRRKSQNTEGRVAQRGNTVEAPNVAVSAYNNTPELQRNIVGDMASGAFNFARDAAGQILDFGANIFWELVERLGGRGLVNILRQIQREGVLNFFKTKIMQAVNKVFDGLENNSSGISAVFPQFGQLVARARTIVNALASGDCKPLFAALNDLKEVVSKLAGEAWDKIVEFYQPSIDFLKNVWESFALPALDWLKAKAEHIWNWVKKIGADIWNWFKPVRDAASQAWDFLKGIIGLNADETGEEGLIQWAQHQAESVWEEIKIKVQPIIAPARQMVAKIQAMMPLNAILNLRKTIQDWLKKVVATSTAMGNDASNIQNEATQISLRDEILPAIQNSIERFRGRITEASEWINNKIGGIFSAVSDFFSTVRSISLLSFASNAIDWLETKASELNEWIQSKVTSLFEKVSEGLHNFGKFLKPIYDGIKKVLAVLGDLLGKLPDFLGGPLWMMLPDCIKEPIKKFLLEQILERMPFFQKLKNIENIWERLEAAALVILKQIFIDFDLRKALWTFYSTMLDIIGVPPQLVTRVIAKAAQNLSDILDDPLGFLGNFLKSLKLGFEQFFNNFGTHLLSGLQAWLLGKLEGTGIEMPKDFSFKSMLKLAFDILGITVDMLLRNLEEVTGKKGLKAKIERVIGAISKAFEWFEKLMSQGEEGGSFWDRLESAIGNIWDTILDTVAGWLEQTIVVKALAWIASKLDPTGIMAIITTIMDVFNVIQAIAEKAREILEIIEKVLDGIGDLIKGIIAAAANILERALAAAIPVAMAVLSAIVGLDGVVDQVKEAITKLREKVEAGVKRVMTAIKNWIERLLGGGQDEEEGDSIEKALQEIETEGEKEQDENEITPQEAENIKNKVNAGHPTKIQITNVQEGEETWNFAFIQKVKKKDSPVKVDKNKRKKAKGEYQKKFGLIESPEISNRSGNLDCSSSTLDRRIGGKRGDKMQAHHAISCSVASPLNIMKAASESGYDINNSNNGILLPSSDRKWSALDRRGTPLPLHRGPHTLEYYEAVSDLLLKLQQNAESKKDKPDAFTESVLLSEIAKIENKLKSKISSYNLTLGYNDPSLH